MPSEKVLLISILKDSHRNLSCLSLFSALAGRNIDVKLLFLPKEEEYDEAAFGEFVRGGDFGIIGISLMTSGFNFAKALTSAVREHSPTTHVVWGGIHPTLMPDECLDHADSVCVGEGELTLQRLAEAVFSGGDASGIPGIGVKKPGGGKVVNKPAPLINDLDSLPFSRYDWDGFYLQDASGLRAFGRDEYVRYSNYNGDDYTLMASRSCPFSCAYCCNSFLNELYGNKGRIRTRSVDNVIQEIKHAMSYIGEIKFINFIDDHFFLSSKEWLGRFTERYAEEIKLPFIVRVVPGSFDEDDMKKLKAAGLRFVQIGLQSGSENTHKQIFNRKFNRDKFISAARILNRCGIHPFYDVIIQNDFENDADRDETLRLLLDLKKPFSLFLFALTPFPKTRLETMYEERGIKPRTDPYGKGYADYDENDFHYQLAGLIPYMPGFAARMVFRMRKVKAARTAFQVYYRAAKTRERKNVTAQ
ncbi:MAG TPA: radical SAM protein [bacterium]|nr:radical SAM protein [bacterium]